MKKLLLYIVFLIAISATAQQNSTSTIEEVKIEKLKPYKENVHASYYHDKFTGRKTASGIKFDNNKLTAAHKKLPFGTMLKITNKINQKSVIVKVNDRGPFINGREIDLSKKAFMDITSNKKSGGMIVTIEILEN
jgi:rare lipoprotein A